MVIVEESFYEAVVKVFNLITENICCISPSTINVYGSVDCTCFDKTGTITKDGRICGEHCRIKMVLPSFHGKVEEAAASQIIDSIVIRLC